MPSSIYKDCTEGTISMKMAGAKQNQSPYSEIPDSAFPKEFVLNITAFISSDFTILFVVSVLFFPPHPTISESNSQNFAFATCLREPTPDPQLHCCQDAWWAVTSCDISSFYKGLLKCFIWLTQHPRIWYSCSLQANTKCNKIHGSQQPKLAYKIKEDLQERRKRLWIS